MTPEHKARVAASVTAEILFVSNKADPCCSTIADIVPGPELSQSAAMNLSTIAFLSIGAVLLIRPQVVSRPMIRRRTERLDRLRAGAEENHLDERRALETYRWVGGAFMWRAFGVLLVLIGLFRLMPPYVPPQGP